MAEQMTDNTVLRAGSPGLPVGPGSTAAATAASFWSPNDADRRDDTSSVPGTAALGRREP